MIYWPSYPLWLWHHHPHLPKQTTDFNQYRLHSLLILLPLTSASLISMVLNYVDRKPCIRPKPTSRFRTSQVPQIHLQIYITLSLFLTLRRVGDWLKNKKWNNWPFQEHHGKKVMIVTATKAAPSESKSFRVGKDMLVLRDWLHNNDAILLDQCQRLLRWLFPSRLKTRLSVKNHGDIKHP